MVREWKKGRAFLLSLNPVFVCMYVYSISCKLFYCLLVVSMYLLISLYFLLVE